MTNSETQRRQTHSYDKDVFTQLGLTSSSSSSSSSSPPSSFSLLAVVVVVFVFVARSVRAFLFLNFFSSVGGFERGLKQGKQGRKRRSRRECFPLRLFASRRLPFISPPDRSRPSVLRIGPSIHRSICLSIYLTIHPPIQPPIYPFISSSVRPSASQSILLPVLRPLVRCRLDV